MRVCCVACCVCVLCVGVRMLCIQKGEMEWRPFPLTQVLDSLQEDTKEGEACSGLTTPCASGNNSTCRVSQQTSQAAAEQLHLHALMWYYS